MADSRRKKKREKKAENGHSRGVGKAARKTDEGPIGIFRVRRPNGVADMDLHAADVVRVILSAADRGRLTDAEAAKLDEAFERTAGDFMKSAAGPDPVPDTFGRAVQRAMAALSPVRPRKRRPVSAT